MLFRSRKKKQRNEGWKEETKTERRGGMDVGREGNEVGGIWEERRERARD